MWGGRGCVRRDARGGKRRGGRMWLGLGRSNLVTGGLPTGAPHAHGPVGMGLPFHPCRTQLLQIEETPTQVTSPRPSTTQMDGTRRQEPCATGTEVALVDVWMTTKVGVVVDADVDEKGAKDGRSGEDGRTPCRNWRGVLASVGRPGGGRLGRR